MPVVVKVVWLHSSNESYTGRTNEFASSSRCRVHYKHRICRTCCLDTMSAYRWCRPGKTTVNPLQLLLWGHSRMDLLCQAMGSCSWLKKRSSANVDCAAALASVRWPTISLD